MASSKRSPIEIHQKSSMYLYSYFVPLIYRCISLSLSTCNCVYLRSTQRFESGGRCVEPRWEYIRLFSNEIHLSSLKSTTLPKAFHKVYDITESSFHSKYDIRSRAAQVVPAWQPGCEKIERKWRENEKMERGSLSTFSHFLFISSLTKMSILSQNVKYGTFVANVRKKLIICAMRK